MAFHIRDATRADHAVYARLFPELAVPDPVLSEERFAAEMLPRTVVVEEGGLALGYGHYRVYGDLAHVAHVVADPHARGRGVGRSLMQQAETEAYARGCVGLYLDTFDPGAAQFYARCGFAPFGQIEDFPPGFSRTFLYKKLFAR